MTLVQGKHYKTLRPVTVRIEGHSIAAIDDLVCSEEDAESLPVIAPGFFDIQVNGYNGIWFCSPKLTVDGVVEVTQALVNKGIARYFPTLITASFDALRHGFATLKKASEESDLVAAAVAGYHLEGPYISSEDGPRGAHPLQHVRPADYEEFSRLQEASGNRIRLVTLAAESENAVSFIEKCQRDGVVVSIGHTAADSEQIQAAVDAGARLSTHLGNGAHGTLRRHPNYIWDQLASDRLWASIIADGWHLPQSVLTCFLRCKDPSRTILTCDASGFAGCAPGIYHEGDVGVEVLEDGRVVVAGQRQFLAGSGATTGDCVVHLCDACGVSVATAVTMATQNPARLLGYEIPDVNVGNTATLTIFSIQSDREDGVSQFVPIETYVQGRLLTGPETPTL